MQHPKSGEVDVVDVPPPRLRERGVLVATGASLISAGTERSKIELGEKSMLGKARARPDLAKQVIEKARRDGLRETYAAVMQQLDAPAALGYSAAGEVVAVGEDCPGIAVGDLVACAGAGYANHAEVLYVPRNLVAKVPEGVTVNQACFATLGAIAMQGVRQADLTLGSRVAVIGLGLVGLLAVQLVRAAGGRALGIDVDAGACALADGLGAERTVTRADRVEEVVEAFTEGVGVDAVLICASTSSNDPVELAGEIARDRATVVMVGAVGMTVPREPYYLKELDFRLSRSYGPGRYDPSYEESGVDYPIGHVRWTEGRNVAEVLRLIGDRLVDVDALTSHTLPIDRAQDAYDLITGKSSDGTRPIGVVLTYPGARAAAEAPRVPASPVRESVGRVRVGAVGAGSFAGRILLPAFAGSQAVVPSAVATSSGTTARHAAQRFGFRSVLASGQEVVASPEVDAVVIATRHDSHAPLAAAAIRAGKAVFCEKPLATTWEGLEDVASAYADGAVPLMVGFNRRYSPMTEALRAALPAGVPRAITCRVNAGPLPRDHWTRDPVAGGGRIVGELCHFLDLAASIAEGEPTRVSAELLAPGGGLDESVAVNIAFADGSIAAIQYLANGDPSLPKERIEVFGGGVVTLIDDWRRLEISRDGDRETTKARSADKGHAAEVASFIDAVTAGRAHEADGVFWSSALTLQVPEALVAGHTVAVSLPQALGGLGARATL